MHDPGSLGHKIETMWVFAAADETGEGVVGARMGDTLMPLVAADEDRLKSLYPMADALCQSLGRPIRLLKFTGRVQVAELVPGQRNVLP